MNFINITFTNNGSFGESDVNTPITMTGYFNGAYYTKLSPLVVGKIIYVTPQLVFAEIEEQYSQELTMMNARNPQFFVEVTQYEQR